MLYDFTGCKNYATIAVSIVEFLDSIGARVLESWAIVPCPVLVTIVDEHTRHARGQVCNGEVGFPLSHSRRMKSEPIGSTRPIAARAREIATTVLVFLVVESPVESREDRWRWMLMSGLVAMEIVASTNDG